MKNINNKSLGERIKKTSVSCVFPHLILFVPCDIFQQKGRSASPLKYNMEGNLSFGTRSKFFILSNFDNMKEIRTNIRFGNANIRKWKQNSLKVMRKYEGKYHETSDKKCTYMNLLLTVTWL